MSSKFGGERFEPHEGSSVSGTDDEVGVERGAFGVDSHVCGERILPEGVKGYALDSHDGDLPVGEPEVYELGSDAIFERPKEVAKNRALFKVGDGVASFAAKAAMR